MKLKVLINSIAKKGQVLDSKYRRDFVRNESYKAIKNNACVVRKNNLSYVKRKKTWINACICINLCLFLAV